MVIALLFALLSLQITALKITRALESMDCSMINLIKPFKPEFGDASSALTADLLANNFGVKCVRDRFYTSGIVFDAVLDPAKLDASVAKSIDGLLSLLSGIPINSDKDMIIKGVVNAAASEDEKRELGGLLKPTTVNKAVQGFSELAALAQANPDDADIQSEFINTMFRTNKAKAIERIHAIAKRDLSLFTPTGESSEELAKAMIQSGSFMSTLGLGQSKAEHVLGACKADNTDPYACWRALSKITSHEETELATSMFLKAIQTPDLFSRPLADPIKDLQDIFIIVDSYIDPDDDRLARVLLNILSKGDCPIMQGIVPPQITALMDTLMVSKFSKTFGRLPEGTLKSAALEHEVLHLEDILFAAETDEEDIFYETRMAFYNLFSHPERHGRFLRNNSLLMEFLISKFNKYVAEVVMAQGKGLNLADWDKIKDKPPHQRFPEALQFLLEPIQSQELLRRIGLDILRNESEAINASIREHFLCKMLKDNSWTKREPLNLVAMHRPNSSPSYSNTFHAMTKDDMKDYASKANSANDRQFWRHFLGLGVAAYYSDSCVGQSTKEDEAQKEVIGKRYQLLRNHDACGEHCTCSVFQELGDINCLSAAYLAYGFPETETPVDFAVHCDKSRDTIAADSSDLLKEANRLRMLAWSSIFARSSNPEVLADALVSLRVDQLVMINTIPLHSVVWRDVARILSEGDVKDIPNKEAIVSHLFNFLPQTLDPDYPEIAIALLTLPRPAAIDEAAFKAILKKLLSTYATGLKVHDANQFIDSEAFNALSSQQHDEYFVYIELLDVINQLFREREYDPETGLPLPSSYNELIKNEDWAAEITPIALRLVEGLGDKYIESFEMEDEEEEEEEGEEKDETEKKVRGAESSPPPPILEDEKPLLPRLMSLRAADAKSTHWDFYMKLVGDSADMHPIIFRKVEDPGDWQKILANCPFKHVEKILSLCSEKLDKVGGLCSQVSNALDRVLKARDDAVKNSPKGEEEMKTTAFCSKQGTTHTYGWMIRLLSAVKDDRMPECRMGKFKAFTSLARECNVTESNETVDDQLKPYSKFIEQWTEITRRSLYAASFNQLQQHNLESKKPRDEADSTPPSKEVPRKVVDRCLSKALTPPTSPSDYGLAFRESLVSRCEEMLNDREYGGLQDDIYRELVDKATYYYDSKVKQTIYREYIRQTEGMMSILRTFVDPEIWKTATDKMPPNAKYPTAPEAMDAIRTAFLGSLKEIRASSPLAPSSTDPEAAGDAGTGP